MDRLKRQMRIARIHSPASIANLPEGKMYLLHRIPGQYIRCRFSREKSVCVCVCEFNVERECGLFDQIKMERRITGYETRSENLISSINNSSEVIDLLFRSFNLWASIFSHRWVKSEDKISNWSNSKNIRNRIIRCVYFGRIKAFFG